MTFGVHESGCKNKSSGAYAGRFDISIVGAVRCVAISFLARLDCQSWNQVVLLLPAPMLPISANVG
jgi:hypothetical protein